MSTTENPTKPTVTPDAVRQRIKNACGQVQAFIQSKGNVRLQELWPEWKSRFERLYKSSQQHPQVAISLVGDTGAGKSTLLNALIGARVLPVIEALAEAGARSGRRRRSGAPTRDRGTY